MLHELCPPMPVQHRSAHWLLPRSGMEGRSQPHQPARQRRSHRRGLRESCRADVVGIEHVGSESTSLQASDREVRPAVRGLSAARLAGAARLPAGRAARGFESNPIEAAHRDADGQRHQRQGGGGAGVGAAQAEKRLDDPRLVCGAVPLRAGVPLRQHLRVLRPLQLRHVGAPTGDRLCAHAHGASSQQRGEADQSLLVASSICDHRRPQARGRQLHGREQQARGRG
mmetsp:Transcript_13496/g.31069  ORF Transcript_13496/g.31069 Transcript_13496/m.31069 type:complete len:227 (-) Transcript_13496:1208-1888(-)